MSPVQKPERVRGSAKPQKVNALPDSRLWAADIGQGSSTKKMLKNIDRTQNVYENKGNMDTMPDVKTDIYVDMTCL